MPVPGTTLYIDLPEDAISTEKLLKQVHDLGELWLTKGTEMAATEVTSAVQVASGYIIM